MSDTPTESLAPDSEQVMSALRAYAMFRNTSTEDINELSKRFNLVNLAAGETLFEEGDESDALYLVVDGELIVYSSLADAGINRIGPNESVGEIALLTGSPRSATVKANSHTTMLRLSKANFITLAQEQPAIIWQFAEMMAPRVHWVYLEQVLKTIFDQVSSDELSTLANELEWITLRQADTLFEQGATGSELYIVISGRLRAIHHEDDQQRVLGDIEPGGVVGEMALFSDEIRSASVIAVRESLLVKMSRSVFERLSNAHPAIMAHVTRVMVERMRENFRSSHSKPSQCHNFALLPHDANFDLAATAEAVREAFAGLGPVLLLDAARFDTIFEMPGAARSDLDRALNEIISHHLTDLEARYTYIVYVTDPTWTPWTERCIQQADRVLLLASAGADPEPGVLEAIVRERFPQTRRELLLLHPPATALPSGTARWLEPDRFAAYYHLRQDDASHFQRMARRLSGKAIGLVLSGGGSRGFTHIGVIKAMQEAGIDIDMIGGASMGANIAAAYGYKLDYAPLEAFALTRATARTLFDYTLPLLSLTSSAKMKRILLEFYGEVRLEDHWIPTFAVATNLTRAELMVIDSGPSWYAVRMSMSIPGFFAPVNYDGNLVIDGGVMNNFPADIMRERYGPGLVIGSMASGMGSTSKYHYDLETEMSGWRLLVNRLNPLAKTLKVPTLPGIVVGSMEVNGIHQMQLAREEVDLLVRPDLRGFSSTDYSRNRELIERGYGAALPMARNFKAQHPSAQQNSL